MKSVPSTTITVLLSAATLVAVTGCSVPEMPADIQSGITANDPAAFYKAGMFYDNLKNASNSSKWAKSAELYRKGAELGDAGCQRELGYAYQIGAGVPKDYGQARAWYMRAAEQNNADALNDLGYLYNNGIGVPVNYAVAKDYYERSRALGSASAVSNLGFMYQKGQGVKVDNSKALKLYEQAAAMGNSVAKDNATTLRREMAMQSPASIKGKTFSFAAPYTLGYRADGSTFRSDSYATDTIAWKWGNKKELVTHENGCEATADYEYKKTGKNTALLEAGQVEYLSPVRPESMFKEYVLTFETPTSGTCTLEVTGRYSTIGANKYTATGRFTIK